MHGSAGRYVDSHLLCTFVSLIAAIQEAVRPVTAQDHTWLLGVNTVSRDTIKELPSARDP